MEKNAIIIGVILAIFLVSSSYAILTNDDGDYTNTSENNNITVNNSVNVDKSVDLESEINRSNPTNSVSENPTADRIHTVNGKTFFEGYDGNNNRFVSEINVTPYENFVDETGNYVAVVSDNSEENDNSENQNLDYKEIYSELPFGPENMVYF